ncbi:MAG TPA: efflux RND transporter periplasmic adaptor subunit [Vicinamibacteria bacterium]|nr:efflux RND transporter periplasmic adaptor subunit [Vicinamibacteria bacterium]
MANGNGNGRKKSRRRLILGALALVLLSVFGLVAARRGGHEIDPSRLAAVEKSDLARSVVATGKVQPLTKVEIKSKASGIVEKLDVDYGERVKEGQVLAELDKEQLEAAVRAGRANLLAAEASWERTKIAAEGPDLPFLLTALERSRKLYADGLIAPSLLEDADKAYQLALNAQTAAKSQARVSKAEVEKARASLEQAESDLRYATIRSPMDGLVLSRDVEVGDAVSSILVLGSQATLVMTLGDVSEVYVLGKVDEADIGRVYMGQRARIVVESFKDKSFEGKVTKISPLGKEKDNVTTFEVRVSISNPTGELKTNMTANAEIILEEKKGVLIVPESAVLYDKDRKPSLEVPDPRAEGGKRKLAVKLGISNGVKTELVQGLKEGDKVVLQ